ncbi:MAG: hypothetical protein IPP51_04035 [Bacteroidetes bacterium]|nr:hypothetical protein [Bacteroidota bacterium]
MNLVSSYKFGKKDAWQVNARWNFGSPFPFTQSQGYFESMLFPNGAGTDILTQNGDISTYYGQLNNGRLSYFHRLDISVQRTFTFSKNTTLEVTAGATNVYNRDNIFYVNRMTGVRIYQLPIIPSLGLNFSF